MYLSVCEVVVGVCALSICVVVFFFKQKTAYEMRISDWSSDVCSSDLSQRLRIRPAAARGEPVRVEIVLPGSRIRGGCAVPDAVRLAPRPPGLHAADRKSVV